MGQRQSKPDPVSAFILLLAAILIYVILYFGYSIIMGRPPE